MPKSLLHPGDRDAVFARVARLTPQSRPLWGRMNVEGMMNHLSDSFDVCTGARAVPDYSKWYTRTIFRLVAISLPLRFPKSTPTAPEVNQDVEGTPSAGFDADRARLVDTATRFTADLDPVAWVHPLFGRLTRAEWGRWAWRHMDHHLRQFGV